MGFTVKYQDRYLTLNLGLSSSLRKTKDDCFGKEILRGSNQSARVNLGAQNSVDSEKPVNLLGPIGCRDSIEAAPGGGTRVTEAKQTTLLDSEDGERG